MRRSEICRRSKSSFIDLPRGIRELRQSRSLTVTKAESFQVPAIVAEVGSEATTVRALNYALVICYALPGERS